MSDNKNFINKEILKFSDWKLEQEVNEDLDVNQNIKDLEQDRTDAQAIFSKIESVKTINTPEQVESTKETIMNQYKDKKGSATIAGLTLMELECQHRLYQIKTEEARKKFIETIKGLNDTIKAIKDKTSGLTQNG